MIPARKQRWFGAWFARHAEARIRAGFAGLHVRGMHHLQTAALKGPVLIVSNHSAWWDPLLALVLVDRLCRLDGYAMMDANNLRRLPFFGLVGAFGVDLDQPRDGGLALRYAARLLDRPGRVCWVYPQGAERPHTAPLRFKPGSGALARLAPQATTVPIAIRYEHGGLERPEIYVDLGPPLPGTPDAAQNTAVQELAVSLGLAGLDAAICDGDRRGFQTFYPWSEPWLARVMTRALAWLTRPLRLSRAEAAPSEPYALHRSQRSAVAPPVGQPHH